MEPKRISEHDLLEDKFAKHDELIKSIMVPLLLTYSIIFFVGIFGNLATCFVIVRSPAMRTATNCYLFSLAISDLILLLLSMPFAFMSILQPKYSWPIGRLGCKSVHYLCETSIIVSLLTIMAFSFERYEAICHPFRLRKIKGSKRPIRVILSCWVLGVVAAIPVFLNMNVFIVEYSGKLGNLSGTYVRTICIAEHYYAPYYTTNFVVLFLVPTIMILVFYVKIALRIHEKPFISENQNPDRLRARNSITRLLCAVVVTFFVCFSPYHVSRMLVTHVKYYSDILAAWVDVTYFMGTAANPILYNAMSSRYRKAFKETIFCASISDKENKTESSEDET